MNGALIVGGGFLFLAWLPWRRRHYAKTPHGWIARTLSFALDVALFLAGSAVVYYGFTLAWQAGRFSAPPLASLAGLLVAGVCLWSAIFQGYDKRLTYDQAIYSSSLLYALGLVVLAGAFGYWLW
ncbi:hypothetical protein [Ottowia sp.]|uniref:hypothetical protein n=1 Tax=Ottowia sp. TaxID=1898956 RepID=UPI00345EF6C2